MKKNSRWTHCPLKLERVPSSKEQRRCLTSLHVDLIMSPKDTKLLSKCKANRLIVLMWIFVLSRHITQFLLKYKELYIEIYSHSIIITTLTLFLPIKYLIIVQLWIIKILEIRDLTLLRKDLSGSHCIELWNRSYPCTHLNHQLTFLCLFFSFSSCNRLSKLIINQKIFINF